MSHLFDEVEFAMSKSKGVNYSWNEFSCINGSTVVIAATQFFKARNDVPLEPRSEYIVGETR